jgi:hypothetical protein
MDASDTIRKRKAQALFFDQLNTLIQKNPSGDCPNLQSCCTGTTQCVKTFESYQNKYDFYYGKNACSSNSCTPYPLNGGSR